ncbi:MAG: HPr kinase/phosphorylase [Acidobacteria bacterium OLB17]|nr:MAG: HPr kinase/phosphorylase [Acidobacteria bacterium OLB17]MCZ2392207.1 hypothetical protein [Acidobacteriota bacterium]
MALSSHRFDFVSFGLAIRFESRNARILERAIETARRSLLGDLQPSNRPAEHVFVFGKNNEHGYFFEHNGELITHHEIARGVFKYFDSYLRVRIGEHCPDRVFVHAGVVGINGRALLIPGNSFSGKSTLVLELVKRGATYFSDEFAILDERGFVHPYARPINMRTDDGRYRPYNVDVSTDKAASSPMPVGAVLFTKYAENARFRPRILTPAEGMMTLTPFTLPIRINSAYSIRVMQRVMENALIIRSKRTHAPRFAEIFLQYLTKVL